VNKDTIGLDAVAHPPAGYLLFRLLPPALPVAPAAWFQCPVHTSVPEWKFVLTFVALNAGSLKFDFALSIFRSSSRSLLLYRRL
jgi:hypothetical protein